MSSKTETRKQKRVDDTEDDIVSGDDQSSMNLDEEESLEGETKKVKEQLQPQVGEGDQQLIQLPIKRDEEVVFQQLPSKAAQRSDWQFSQIRRLMGKNRSLRSGITSDLMKKATEIRQLSDANNNLSAQVTELNNKIQAQVSEKQMLEMRLKEIQSSLKQDSELKRELESIKNEVQGIMRAHAVQLRTINNDLQRDEMDMINALRKVDENTLKKAIISNIESDLLAYEIDSDLAVKYLKTLDTDSLVEMSNEIDRVLQMVDKRETSTSDAEKQFRQLLRQK
jgi:hypothetical protein